MYNLTRKSAQSIINISWACLVPPVLSHAIYSRKVLTNHLFRITRRKFLLSSKFTFDLVICGKKHFDAGDSSVTRHARKRGRKKLRSLPKCQCNWAWMVHTAGKEAICFHIKIFKYTSTQTICFKGFFLHMSKTILANSKIAFPPSSLPFLFYAQKKKGTCSSSLPAVFFSFCWNMTRNRRRRRSTISHILTAVRQRLNFGTTLVFPCLFLSFWQSPRMRKS